MNVSSTRGRRAPLRAVPAVLAALLVLSACGSAEEPSADQASAETSPSPSEASPSTTDEPSEDPTGGAGQAPEEPYVPGNPQNQFRPATDQELREWPACGAVWQQGKTIPRGYEGCIRSGENAIVADRIGCSFGGAMTTYFDRYYGVVGNVVTDARSPLSRSREYAKDYRLCSG